MVPAPATQPPGPGHTFQQISGIFTGDGGSHHLATVTQTFGIGDFHLAVRVAFLDDIDYGLGNTTGYGEITAVGRGVVDARSGSSSSCPRSMSLAAKMPAISSKVKTKSTSLRTLPATCFQLFSGAGTDEDDLGIRILVFDQTSCQVIGVRAMEIHCA